MCAYISEMYHASILIESKFSIFIYRCKSFSIHLHNNSNCNDNMSKKMNSVRLDIIRAVLTPHRSEKKELKVLQVICKEHKNVFHLLCSLSLIYRIYMIVLFMMVIAVLLGVVHDPIFISFYFLLSMNDSGGYFDCSSSFSV
ncbi:hypothetical protein BDA99DRAFT_536146 [Phascolomyces articulosus]|uniref:Uncharacterized protein n=1 Tax=Phascolomyces articulosus TaxID=60185 RepID=A0AAD5K2W9_9FUNG|nr:hypothetical protein BDA99DRAFT_536146 [Phascolomyces articulosus]